jgi:HSP20 family molecular chaperone IbpA
MNTDTSTTRREADQAERMSARDTVAPRVDIYENTDEFLIVVDLPGVSHEKLRIDLDRGQLSLHAQREVSLGRGEAIVAEFGPRQYQRVFALPRGIDTERVAAELKNGVLTLRLPKSASLKPRRIEVKPS